MIEHFRIIDKTVYINTKNGDNSYDLSEVLDLDFEMDEIQMGYSSYKMPRATFCLNISNACNLNCDYCFNKNKTNKSLTIEEVKEFLDNAFNLFPDKEKYFVDLSGKGEPLTNLKLILKINKYCIELSNKIRKQVLVSFVCNGTLLSPNVANTLQKEGILFGVSLDGNQVNHDLHRRTQDNKPTFERIINNVKSIKHREYIGCAITITKDVFDLLETELKLLETFNTISVKPARSCDDAIDENSINNWLVEYEKLAKYLINQASKGDTKLLYALLNGDDYFGKFILRAFLNIRVFVRCDAGLSRITLDENGVIYPCPAASSHEKMILGKDFVVETEKIEQIFDEQYSEIQCNDCGFKYLCGGECLIEMKINGHKNEIMCKYKKHLILLAIYLKNEIYLNDDVIFQKVYDFCAEIQNRHSEDKKLKEFLDTNKDLSFVEAKKVYDNLNKKY